MEPETVTDILEIMKKHVGDLVIYWEKRHTFRGMNIIITEDKKKIVEMKYQLIEAI